MKRAFATVAVLFCLGLAAASQATAFGIAEADSIFATVGPALAGSHEVTQETTLAFETTAGTEGFEVPDGAVRDVTVSLPPGLVGNTKVVTPCSTPDFGVEECPASSRVGTALARLFGPPQEVPAEVFLLQAPPGAVARLGFHAVKVPVTIDLKVNPAPPYNVIATLHNTSNAVPIYSSVVKIEGEPAGASGPFLTLPRSCQGPQPTVFQGDSWEEPTVLTPPKVGPSVLTTSGCDSLSFGPTISASGSSHFAESPSGLDFDLEVSDPGLTEPGGRADSDIERATVTLPQGFTTNPSVAAGLSACSLAEYHAEPVEFDPSAGCPDSSNVGTVEVTTPLLDEKLSGQIYVAKQGENETGNNLLGLYMIIRNEARGILVKQPLRVDPDPKTGRLTTTVSDIPQLPFSDFHLHFREGPRAPLITPATCGSYEVSADLYPYAQAQGVAPVHRTADLTVSSGAGGSGCAATPEQQPTAFQFNAGTTNSTAGTYSPFLLNLSRPDGAQQLARIDTTLPAGLLGKLAGIPYCPESAIAQAQARSGEGGGAVEIASPSCPAASLVGTVAVASGAGPEPLYVSGKAYLAGPYKGAALSLEIVTPAIAGPFDLGVVAVRTALRVDPITTQITAESDPIPTILHGLPLDVRSISVGLDRPQFTLNPTSCEPKAITGSAISTLGNITSLSQYFQAQKCAALKFKPSLKLTLKGQTRRTGHPGLMAVLTYPKGGAYANIARAQVNLPHSEFVEQNNLNKTCTKPVLLEGKCPAKAIYGKAKAWTPLLEKPLEGNVYLVGGFGFKLPALVAELDGQIRVLLAGKIDSGPNKGIRNTFEAVPDAPIEKFELKLKGGPKYSLLVNSENLCKKPRKAIARFTAQNGTVQQTKPLIANDCKKKSRGAKKAKNGRGRKPSGR
jgi:hypothetical protein